MDTTPANRLLQLLRQKSQGFSEEYQSEQSSALRKRRRPKPTAENSTQPATISGTQPATIGGTQYAKSGTQPATIGSTQPATENGTQPAKSSTQPATESGIQPAKSSIQPATESGIQPATESGILFTMVGLSKGQERVLKYLMSIRDTHNPSQTAPVGYYMVSRSCFLSRNGARKVMSELCRKGLIRQSETKRGEHQGTVYFLESSTQYATKSGTPDNLESSTQYATFGGTCSSSTDLRKQQLQTLTLEDTFQDLNPQSLVPYLDQFDTTEQLQNFLDVANACIASAQSGHGKPIQNPQGFLFAQLKAGYINPPADFKSRKIRAQEIRNRRLEEEFATLRHLKEREQELEFALFREKLTEKQQERLEQEARAQYKPGLGLSERRQIAIAKDEIVKQWFQQWGQMDAETTT